MDIVVNTRKLLPSVEKTIRLPWFAYTCICIEPNILDAQDDGGDHNDNFPGEDNLYLSTWPIVLRFPNVLSGITDKNALIIAICVFPSITVTPNVVHIKVYYILASSTIDKLFNMTDYLT